MDINFHYYTVKTLAVKAGYTDDEAQTIANYSQFVDDFTNYKYMLLSSVPGFARHLATKLPGNVWLFNPVTTGFESWFDMALLLLEKNQKNILTPFHFIPQHKKLNEKSTNREEWRVVPARLELDSLIQQLLVEAKAQYLQNNSKENIIRIGLLLHIFADTYAHQGYSGSQGWENYAKLLSATDNRNGKDITGDYSPGVYHQLPAIGHTETNHAPDDSNISFDIEMKYNEKDKYSLKYGRSNTREFQLAAREIIDFLLSCKGKKPISTGDWIALSEQIAKGFLTDQKVVAALNTHWSGIFPGINYHYNRNEMLSGALSAETNDLLSSRLATPELANALNTLARQGVEIDTTLYATKSDDFFHYNVIADKVRTFVNGGNIVDERWNSLVLSIREDIPSQP